jgi:DNA topoisomerase-1
MMKNLLIVESPGKIKKLKSILGNDWIVLASCGHIRELAKDTPDSLGFVLLGDRIETHYIIRDARSEENIAKIRTAALQASTVILATDEDREGESISWHLKEVLGLKNPRRATFTEITKPAVLRAIAQPRQLDENLVAAARCRDCLDKLVGYRVSPLVWQLNNGSVSAGRVQSAALHLLCEREREIERFVPQDYWLVFVEYVEGFKAFYAGSDKSVQPDVDESSGGSDDAADEEDEGDVTPGTRVSTQEQAFRLVNIAQTHPHQVVEVKGRTDAKKPPTPFTTSALQQAAGVRLGQSPEQVMRVAQHLYEQGLITYMRTDSVVLSSEFCSAAGEWLLHNDPDNIRKSALQFKNKEKAQEAHEAIRPTHVEQTPNSVDLTGQELALYDLIWRRAIASQCADAVLQKTTILTKSGSVSWLVRGQVLVSPGYTVYWNDISADSQLPSLSEGQRLTLKAATSQKKQTTSPPRYTQPRLVQLLEKVGIGRPSTYAPTIAVLKSREYVSLKGKRLQPTRKGTEVDEFLLNALPELLQADFTAQMEQTLDSIAQGKENWEYWLNQWNASYFVSALAKAQSIVNKINPTGQPSKKSVETVTTDIHCPNCDRVMLKIFYHSPKMHGDHFLKCDAHSGGCGAAMFLDESEEYVLAELVDGRQSRTKNSRQLTKASHSKPSSRTLSPMPMRSQKEASEAASSSGSSTATQTSHACPVCGNPLEQYSYHKDGQAKSMLRCAVKGNRGGKCKDVAFFKTQTGNWWSPQLGELT